MNRKVKIIFIGFFVCIAYFACVKIFAHFLSIYYAKNISKALSSNNIDTIDKFFQDNTIICIEKEERTYEECRENIKAACISGIPIEADSYGNYSGGIQKRFKYNINIAFNGLGVDGTVREIFFGQ